MQVTDRVLDRIFDKVLDKLEDTELLLPLTLNVLYFGTEPLYFDSNLLTF